MGIDLTIFGDFSDNMLVQKRAVNEIISYNEETLNYGLVLTEQQAIELVRTRNIALRDNGRIEFGGGIIGKIINEFCDSPYLTMENYEYTLHELIEMFYYYKDETLDLMGDDELIKFMKRSFDGICQGSLELLSSRELYNLARSLRFGKQDSGDKDDDNDEEDDDDGEY